MQQKQEAKILNYGDRTAQLWLWWKSLLLIPPWAILVVPIFGTIACRLGEGIEQTGYTVVLLSAMLYFTEDLLKRKIRIENNTLLFGFRLFPLKELLGVGLQYKARKVLPDNLILTFASGKTLKLRINGLSAQDFDTLIKTIENCLPECQVDPVLRTLAKCKKLVRRTYLDTDNKIEIPYHSRRVINQLAESFASSAARWKRIGPLAVAVFAAPLWLGFTFWLYSFGRYFFGDSYKKLLVHDVSQELAQQLDKTLVENIGNFSSQVVAFSANPLFVLLITCSFVATIYYLARFIFRPSVLLIDADKLVLNMRINNIGWDCAILKWKNCLNVYLVKPATSADPDRWTIRFDCADGKHFDMAYGAIASHDRTRLLKGIERWAAECRIDPELSEALQPRQERSYTELWLQSLSGSPERKSLDPLTIKQTIQDGRYEVVKRLGVGGQGMAYLCRETSELNDAACQDVVLKETILPVFVEKTIRQQALERFQQEAKMLEELNSDSIVKLLDYFVEDHRGYLVLEHVEGLTLRQVIEQSGAMEEEQARNLAAQMADILIYLHSKSIIHRDFTRDNLILSKQGKLKLIDFNVAQHGDSGKTGTIVGKHAYLPPEQFRGKPTYQSDVYAMGATIFFLLTGKDPEPISESDPSRLRPELSKSLADLVLRCTRLTLSDRASDANTVRTQIYSLYNDDPGAVIFFDEKKEMQSVES